MPYVPKGQHLGASHRVPGAYVGHLFDDETNELKGHAAWHMVDEPSATHSAVFVVDPPGGLTDEERAAETAMYIAAGVLLVELATPFVRKWWDAKGALMMRSAWARRPWYQKRKAALAEQLALNQAKFRTSTTGVEIAVVDPAITMTNAEWAARYRAMVAAGDFEEKQRRILANARIEADDPSAEGGGIPEQLTVQQFADRIASMLEANPSLLNPETSAEFMKVFSTWVKPPRPRPALEQ